MQGRECEQKPLAGWRRWLFKAEVAIIGTIMIAGTVTAASSVLQMLTR